MVKHRTKIEIATELVLDTFRLNGRLIEAGNTLVAPIGLTSARWQVVGVLALKGQAMTVSQIAKDMGLSRQAVQRTANNLLKLGLLEATENPYHQRANLMLLTKKGLNIFDQAMSLHEPWVSNLTKGISAEKLSVAVDVLRLIHDRLNNKATDNF